MKNFNHLKDKLKSETNVDFAYLFGSFANGDNRENSDIDIAVFLHDNSLNNSLQLGYELSKFLQKDVDLLLLNDVKNLYLLESVFSAKTLLKDSPNRVDFELKKEHDILDYKSFKKSLDVA